MSLAPIIIFAFNRLDALRNTVESLRKNSEAAESDLYVFVDGARPNKDGEDIMVRLVQDYVANIYGFKSIHYTFSKENKGLGPSIIAGVTEVISKQGKAIVVEDDLLITPNFLAFMNQGLERYEKTSKVFSICGYSNRVKRPRGYTADSYFCSRSSSWGWATWADRWVSVDWNLERFEQYLAKKDAFNKWGGADCFGMLKGWHDGLNKSWAIRFCFSQFLQDKLSLFPMESKVINDGFDGQGTNCKRWNRFKFNEDKSGKKSFEWPTEVAVVESLRKDALCYHSLFKRAYSKIMYKIMEVNTKSR